MSSRRAGAIAWLFAAGISFAPAACQLLNNKVTVGETRVGQGKLCLGKNRNRGIVVGHALSGLSR